jgi:hypothetical protein
MSNFEASTPQLSVIKKWIDAYTSLDISKVEPLLAKNYQHQSFPESPDAPNETKGEHIQKWGEILAAAAKLEVRIRRQREVRRLTLAAPRSRLTMWSKNRERLSITFVP